MLGKGEKRKLDEDEDGLEGKALAPAEVADGPSKVSYTLQRQTIFNISLMKLYSQRALTEPRLERRVLINNMLRRIQEELRQEGGGPRPLFFPSSDPPDDPADEGFREAPPAFGPAPSPALAAPDSCLTPASLLEDDASLFCTSPSPHPQAQPHGPPRPPPPPATKDSFSSALEEIEELCPTTTTSPAPGAPPHPPSPPAGTDSKDGGKTRGQKPEEAVSLVAEGRVAAATTDAPPPGSLDVSTSSSSSSGFLTDLALDDILFADIDTSMYDFDACTSASGAAPSKAPDDLVKTLSPSVAPSQPFRMDLAELDHIMEVLVGS